MEAFFLRSTANLRSIARTFITETQSALLVALALGAVEAAATVTTATTVLDLTLAVVYWAVCLDLFESLCGLTTTY